MTDQRKAAQAGLVNQSSPRQKLAEFYGSGQLRAALERGHLRPDALELCVDVVGRYCEPTKRKK